MSAIETIYVIASSTLIHLFFLVLALFIVYKYYLDQIFIDKYTANFKHNYNRFIEILIDNYYKDEDFGMLMENLEISKQEVKTEIKEQMDNKLSNMNTEPRKESEKDKHLLFVPKASILILGIALISFVFIYKRVYGKYMNLNYSLLEIILSFTITAVLVFIYQYYLIHEFLVDVIYLRIPRLLKDNVTVV